MKTVIFACGLLIKNLAVNNKHDLIGQIHVGNELTSLKTGHRLSAAGSTPDKSAQLVMVAPFLLSSFTYDCSNGSILIASADLENIFCGISDSIIANQLVRFRNRQNVTFPSNKFTPILYDIVVPVSPAEEKCRIEAIRISSICKEHSILWGYCPEHLHKPHKAIPDAFVSVLDDLVGCFININTGGFQLDMDDRHTVDQKRDITASVVVLRIGAEISLLSDLIARAATGYLGSGEEVEIDLVPGVLRIGRIQITFNGKRTTVNKVIRLYRSVCLQFHNIKHTAHLIIGERNIIQSSAVAFKQDIFPVVDKFRNGLVLQNFLFPACFCKKFDQIRFKI